MSVRNALWWKEWALHRDAVVDCVLVAVLGALIVPWRSATCLLVLCGLAAARLGARLGHDLRLVDTFEFVLTRPIDRRAFVRQHLAFGALVLAATLAAVSTIGELGLRSALFDALAGAALWHDVDVVERSGATTLALASFVVALVYVCAFECGIGRRGQDTVSNVAFEGALRAVALLVVVWLVCVMLPTLFLGVTRESQGRDPTWGGTSASALIAFASCAATALLVWWRVHAAESVVVAFEAADTDPPRLRARGALYVLVAVVLAVAGFLAFFWLAADVGTPVSATRTPSNIGGK